MIKSKFAIALIAAAAIVVGSAGCGDREKTIVYKQGNYQGKSDTPPWNNARYGGDKAKWEAEIRARNQNQNEYRRLGG